MLPQTLYAELSFILKKRESVKHVIYGLGRLDLLHIINSHTIHLYQHIRLSYVLDVPC